MASAATISMMENTAVDQRMPEAFISHVSERPPSEVSPIYDQDQMYSLLSERAQDSHFMMSMGSSNAWTSPHMIEEEYDIDDDDDMEKPLSDDDDEAVLDYLASMEEPLGAEIDLDDYMISMAHTRITRSIKAEHLSKVWRIDMETAEKTIKTTSQNCNRTKSEGLSRNYARNDKMLR
jgi:hypothetical protein